MTWNQHAKKSGLAMGRWYWYRRTSDSAPFPVHVIDIAGLEYAWLCDPAAEDSVVERVEKCQGEFVEQLEPPH